MGTIRYPNSVLVVGVRNETTKAASNTEIINLKKLIGCVVQH